MKLITAIQNNNIDEVRDCLHRNVDMNYEHNGWTPLMLAIENDNLEIITLLLNNYQNINHRGFYGETTVLHHAVTKNNINVVRLLLNYGLDPNADNIRKRTPLMYATTPEMAELLIAYGAQLNCKDCFGDSLLHSSCYEKHSAIMTQFFSKWIDINIKNKCGETALHTACAWIDIKNVQMLLDLGCDTNITDDNGHKAKDITPSQEIKDLIDFYDLPLIKGALDDMEE